MEDSSHALTQPFTDLNRKARVLVVLKDLQDLARVENIIQAKTTSEVRLLHEIPSYLLSIGGKRMRPALALLCAQLFGMTRASEDLVQVSAAIELTHMATLLHDDIIDKSLLRRHHPSPLCKYGIANTLLAGDFLLVRAFGICAALDRHVVEASEAACVELTEGEILETNLYEESHTTDSALNIAAKKTASLFRLAAHLGAYLAGAELRTADAMSVFGESLGIAFQILDDILDVTSDKNLHGKKSGTDLLERKPSIVNVLWLSSGSPLARRLLEKPADGEDAFVAQALEELRDSKVITQAKALAASHAERARQALADAAAHARSHDQAVLPKLQAILDYTLERIE